MTKRPRWRITKHMSVARSAKLTWWGAYGSAVCTENLISSVDVGALMAIMYKRNAWCNHS
jgi:hypothetical protein